MAELASLWIGDRLGAIEIASAQSFLRHGDRLTLYVMQDVAGIPKGVTVRDARDIFDPGRVIRHHKSGSPALHSDLFRYALMQKTDSIWVDLDVIALRSLDGAGDWIFGFEADEKVNCAVLRLPHESRTLRALLEITPDTTGLPPWMTGFRRFKYWLKSAGRGLPIERWPWGAVGPTLLTHQLRKTGEIAHTLPQTVFYPVPYADAGLLLTPGAITCESLPPDTWAVHLWASRLGKIRASEHGGQIPPGSFLAQMLDESIT
ncbi:MAG: hypothetical protein WCZ72_11540 [Gemmobacter sp.]